MAGRPAKSCMMRHAILSSPRHGRAPRRLWRPLAVTHPMNRAPENDSYEALLARVAVAQDRTAFRSLFDHFAPRIKAWMIRAGSNPQQAEELAQEAMLTVWRKAAMFDRSRASVATWIFTIARNLRIDAIRRERHPGFDPADPTFLPDDPLPADSQLQAGQQMQAVRRALDALPDEQSRIVILSFFSDKPHSQIATELGIPLGTVKSRMRLAMQRLKSLLEDTP